MGCTLVGPTVTEDNVWTHANVMDLLVTTNLAAGVNLGFRWYAHTDVYNSAHASTVIFATTRVLRAGGFLRLVYNTVTGIGMKLLYRPPYAVTAFGPPADPLWTEVGYSTSAIGLLNFYAASCLVFFAPNMQSLVGLSAMVFTVGEGGVGNPPPQSVVPCQYVFAPYVYGPGLVFVHAEEIRPQGAWRNLWQVLKWGPGSTWRVAVDSNDYELVMAEHEDRAYLGLLPGQLSPVAYRPYDVENGSFGGEWVLVATKPIPAQTSVCIAVNDWRPDGCDYFLFEENIAYLWTSPVCWDLPAGTVIDLTGLGTSCVRASVGTIAINPVWSVNGQVVDGPIDLYAYTAFSTLVGVDEEDGKFLVEDSEAGHAITGTYPCSYTGVIPKCLVLGRDLPATPWPDCPSILPINSCRHVSNWPCEQLALNNTCPVRWLCQPVPVFGLPKGGDCGCGCVTPMPACAGSVFGCVGSGPCCK